MVIELPLIVATDVSLDVTVNAPDELDDGKILDNTTVNMGDVGVIVQEPIVGAIVVTVSVAVIELD